MAGIKLSQISLAGSEPALTDVAVGIKSFGVGNNDVLWTFSEIFGDLQFFAGQQAVFNKSGTVYAAALDSATINILGDSVFGGGISIFSFNHHSNLAFFSTKSSTSPSTQQVLPANYTIGTQSWYGSDGVAFQSGAFFQAVADTNWAAGSAPTKFNWWVAATGSVSPVAVMQLDSNGNLSIGNYAGSFAPSGQPYVSQSGRPIEIVQSLQQPWYVAYAFANDNSNVAAFVARKSRNNTIGSHSTVISGDNLLFTNSAGSDGSAFFTATSITHSVDTTVSAGVVPGRLSLQTASTAGTLLERQRIDSAGNAVFVNNTTQTTASLFNHGIEQHTSLTQNAINMAVWANDTSNICALQGRKSKNNTIGSHTAVGTNDLIFRIIGNGSDGTAFQAMGTIDFNTDGTVSAGHVPGRIMFTTSSTATAAIEAWRINSGQSLMASPSALGTTATDGFIYINSCAGAPTGVPTAAPGGAVPFVYDTTNHKLWVRDGGAWKGVVLS